MLNTKTPPAWISNSGGITIFYNGESNTIPNSHVNYERILDALKSKRYDSLESLMNVAKAIENYSAGNFKVEHGQVLFNGQVFHNVMSERLLDMMRHGFDVKPLMNFMANLVQNPSRTAVEELYLFLESGKLPITEDGHFLAYKKVRSNFMDHHTGKCDHSPGKTLEMDRFKVDDNRENTCSYGYHFCSLDYLPQFGGNNLTSKVVIVKINPKDVVAIPSDYKNTKGRTCRYVVVGEYKGDWNKSLWNDVPVVDEGDDWQDYTPANPKPAKPEHGMPARDAKGRFLPKNGVASGNAWVIDPVFNSWINP